VNFWLFLFVALFIGLMLAFAVLERRDSGRNLRDIPAYYRLQGAIELAVEDGTRVHIAIGRSEITSPQGAAALVGLSMLQQVCRVASDSDQPPIATAGEGTLAILAQDVIRTTYKTMGLASGYNNSLGRVTGLTPYSYAAGTMSVIIDEGVSANVLAGSFGDEAALITSAGERSQTLTLAGTYSLPGQAILYAAAHEPLIGEEIYAAGAYLDAGPMHAASLHAQDVVRWLLVFLIIGWALYGLFSGFFL
jgi:hypothetical protein